MTAIVLLAAYATGIAMTCALAPWPPAGYGMAAVSLLLCWVVLRRSRWAWLPFLGLLLIAGFLNASLDRQPPPAADHVSRLADSGPLRLEGTLVTAESRPSGGYRLHVRLHQAVTAQGGLRVFGEVMLYIRAGELQARPGQVVCWRSTLRRPARFGNPGEFDYPLHLAAQGIYVTAFIADTAELVVLANHPLARPASVENWRRTLAAQIEESVPHPACGLLQSLLIGMRGGISEEQRQLLAASGVAHLFAISGLHFGLLALLLYQLGKWCYSRSQRLLLWCPPQRILPVLLILPLAGYLLLTGNAWATRRAFLMVAAVALLLARGRRTPPFALLATAAFALLLYSPLALFQAGFQLSFAGIAGILAWLPCWQSRLAGLAKPLRWPVALILTTMAATMATAPATLWHFHQFAPAGLLTNLVAIPLIAWGAVPMGLLSMALFPFSTQLSAWGLQLAGWLVTLALELAAGIVAWPGLAAIPRYLTTASLVLLIGLLLCLLPLGSRPRHWLMRLGVLTAALAVAWLAQPAAVDFRVVAFSVGQGDATLVSLTGDGHYLVDGGGLPGSSIEPGEQLVGPALGRMGIDRLQGVILTHNHPDHSAGLAFILRRFPVATFYFADDFAALAPELQEALRQSGTKVQRLAEGWTHLVTADDQTLSLFTPTRDLADLNERSIAVFASRRRQGVLLPADLGKSGLLQLLETGLPGPATLLKLPHHGSRHAQPGLCIDRLEPALAFVSCGRGNPYGFPHQQAIDACAAGEVPLLRTDRQGMLTFDIADERWQVRPQRAL